MALKSTVYKCELQIIDSDRNYYQTHALTLALHPSETEERLMMRVLAFAVSVHDQGEGQLSSAGGLSTADEPDLWTKDLTGLITQWIEVGLPDEKRIRRACGRAKQVLVFTYGGRATQLWWDKNSTDLLRSKNLQIWDVPQSAELSALAARSMRLQCYCLDGEIQLSNETHTVTLRLLARMEQS